MTHSTAQNINCQLGFIILRCTINVVVHARHINCQHWPKAKHINLHIELIKKLWFCIPDMQMCVSSVVPNVWDICTNPRWERLIKRWYPKRINWMWRKFHVISTFLLCTGICFGFLGFAFFDSVKCLSLCDLLQ